MKDYYKILEVRPDASLDEIKKQYRFLALALHPDRFSSSEHKNKAEEKFKEINEAYAVLADWAKRAEYDRQRLTQAGLGFGEGEQPHQKQTRARPESESGPPRKRQDEAIHQEAGGTAARKHAEERQQKAANKRLRLEQIHQEICSLGRDLVQLMAQKPKLPGQQLILCLTIGIPTISLLACVVNVFSEPINNRGLVVVLTGLSIMAIIGLCILLITAIRKRNLVYENGEKTEQQIQNEQNQIERLREERRNLIAQDYMSESLAEVNQDMVLAISEPMVDNLLEGFNINSYTIFTQDFDHKMKQDLTQAVFDRTRSLVTDRVGVYRARQVENVSQTHRYVTVIYQSRFERDDKVEIIASFEAVKPYHIIGLQLNSVNLD